MSQNPRDMREWMRSVERKLSEARRGAVSVAASLVKDVVVIIDNDKARTPAAPVELVWQTAVYLDLQNRKRVRLTVDFPDVVKATDATDVAIQQYELWGYDETPSKVTSTAPSLPGIAAPGASYPGASVTTTATEVQETEFRLLATSTVSSFRVDNFVPNSRWKMRVRAIGRSTIQPGLWSPETSVQMSADTAGPPQPTAPTVRAERGTLIVEWDGQAVTGTMPADFKYAILAHGNAAAPTFEVHRWGRGGGLHVIADLPYYDVQFLRIQAVDESGNRSPWSETATGYTSPLVDKDLILSTIDAAKTHLKNINAGVSILPNTIITEHLVVTEEMTAAIANFLVVNADHLNANSIWADEIWVGLADAVLVRSDMFIGKEFQGGTFTGGVFQTTEVEYQGIKIDPSGIVAYAATGGVETFRLDAATGNLTANYGTLTGLKYQTHLSATEGIKIDPTLGIKSYNASGQLNFEVTPSGATFTGTVKSGFSTSLQAVLSSSVFSGQPGVQFNLGIAGATQPFITGWTTNNNFSSGSGMLHASAARVAGENPAEIFLSKTGTFMIGNQGAQASQVYGGDNFVAVVRHDSQLQLSSSQTTLWYGSNLGSNAAYFTQSMGYSQLQANDISLRGAVTVNGSLGVTGSKNFIMDHPTKPGMELLHASTESPVSGVEYWGCGTLGPDGADSFQLPEYFDALIKPGSDCVAVYGNGVAVAWTAITDNSVTVTGPAGTGYTWLVKAERNGGEFEVERIKAHDPGPTVASE